MSEQGVCLVVCRFVRVEPASMQMAFVKTRRRIKPDASVQNIENGTIRLSQWEMN